MRIFAIETSCDETAVAVVDARGRRHLRFNVQSNVISSQIRLHRKYGGVVPDLASREHVKNIRFVAGEALKKAGVNFASINLVAATTGPGLIPSLLIGVAFGRMLAYLAKKPIIGVNHVEGHIYANFLHNKPIAFPILALVVSGGHTQLIFIRRHGVYALLGETRDDAAGEAFDKIAKILGLPYPGGPEIARRAEKGNPRSFTFPRPMMHSKDFDFSFSGLKTAVLYEARKHRRLSKLIPDICASSQQAIVDVLVAKTVRAARLYRPRTVFLAGGVAANQSLRRTLAARLKGGRSEPTFFVPPDRTSTDNAAMIAAAAYAKYIFRNKSFSPAWKAVSADANARLAELAPPC